MGLGAKPRSITLTLQSYYKILSPSLSIFCINIHFFLQIDKKTGGLHGDNLSKLTNPLQPFGAAALASIGKPRYPAPSSPLSIRQERRPLKGNKSLQPVLFLPLPA